MELQRESIILKKNNGKNGIRKIRRKKTCVHRRVREEK
jgi:hypothetical protein